MRLLIFILSAIFIAPAGAQIITGTGAPGSTSLLDFAEFSLPRFDFGNSLQGGSGLETSGENAVNAFKKLQERADDHFKAERYDQAFEAYLQLARFNDKYAQYILANMYARGLGVEQNLVEAFAWSYVSAEARQKGFVNYHVSLRAQLTDPQREQGLELAHKHHQAYGTHAIASKARLVVRSNKRNCTGSRLGSSCDRVAVTGFNCNANSQGVLGNECMLMGSIGVPGIAGLQPSDLRIVENHLEDLIRHYNPGRVELGELEIIEDE